MQIYTLKIVAACSSEILVMTVTVRPSRNKAVILFHKDEITMDGGKLPGP
jgi:hypothetical protein